MSRGGVVLGLALALALSATVALSAQSAGDSAYLPGLTVKDPYPNGCVDCHVDQGAGNVIALLSKITGHPKVDKIAKVVPKDCLMCHKAGPKPPVFSRAMHLAHFHDPASNTFVTKYKGACLDCHTLDQTTGVMGMKSGPKNW